MNLHWCPPLPQRTSLSAPGESEGWIEEGPDEVLWTQFPHRSGHNSGGKGCGRLHNKDPRAVGESNVPTVCETGPRTTEWLFLPVS